MKALWKRIKTGEWLTVQRVGIVLLALSVITGIIGYISKYTGGFDFGVFLVDFYANVSTEFASIAITVLIIDTLTRRRETKQAERSDREELVRKLGSKVNEASRQAAESLRAKKWMFDGTLQEIDLRAANLEEADFYCADLQGANFQFAMLKNASLKKANLVGADFSRSKAWGAKCYKADMRGANFTEARLYRADFTSADLQQANFTDAVLEGANLKETNLRGAIFVKTVFLTEKAAPETVTILPDGTHWTPTTDMSKFTDPDHGDFWCPHTPDDSERIDLGDE